MPNSTIEPHGKVIASATPFSSTSRASGAEACTLVPPSRVMKRAIVALAGRTFMPFTSPGTTIFFLVEWNVPGIVREGEAVVHVRHLLGGVFAVPRIERRAARLGVGEEERQLHRAHHREAARLVAGIDMRHVGDAVARHVVVIERLAELLRRIDLHLDRAAGGLLDRSRPGFRRRMHRMRRPAPSARSATRPPCPARRPGRRRRARRRAGFPIVSLPSSHVGFCYVLSQSRARRHSAAAFLSRFSQYV